MLDPPDLDRLPIITCWPDDGGPFITLPAVFTKDPRDGRRATCGMYRIQQLRLGARPALHWQIHKDAAADWRRSGGRMDVAVALGTRPDHRLLGLRAAAQACRRADVGRLPARRAGGAGAREDRRPRGAGQRRDRDRGLRRAGRAARRGPVRRPHRLLHPGRAVPRAARDRDDDAPRRDLPVDRRRRPAGRGRLARQGDRAPVPARRADDHARGGGLRPALRRAPSTTAPSSRSARRSPATRAR